MTKKIFERIVMIVFPLAVFIAAVAAGYSLVASVVPETALLANGGSKLNSERRLTVSPSPGRLSEAETGSRAYSSLHPKPESIDAAPVVAKESPPEFSPMFAEVGSREEKDTPDIAVRPIGESSAGGNGIGDSPAQQKPEFSAPAIAVAATESETGIESESRFREKPVEANPAGAMPELGNGTSGTPETSIVATVPIPDSGFSPFATADFEQWSSEVPQRGKPAESAAATAETASLADSEGGETVLDPDSGELAGQPGAFSETVTEDDPVPVSKEFAQVPARSGPAVIRSGGKIRVSRQAPRSMLVNSGVSGLIGGVDGPVRQMNNRYSGSNSTKPTAVSPRWR